MSITGVIGKKNRPDVPKAMLVAFLAVLIVASATAVAGCGTDGTTTTRPDPTTDAAVSTTSSEDAAPDLSGVTLDGLEISLSEYRGKPLVLAFMASW